jgi:hypothetical protein
MPTKKPDTVPERLLMVAEVAWLFRVDPKTVTRWAAAGRINRLRTIGGHNRFRVSQIRELLLDEGVDNPDALIAAAIAGARGPHPDLAAVTPAQIPAARDRGTS